MMQMPGYPAFAKSPARFGVANVASSGASIAAHPPPSPAPAVTSAAASNPAPSSLPVVPRSTPLMSLPPHRRAQVILEEMAGLTSRLAELGGSKAWQSVSGKLPVPTFLAGATITCEASAAMTVKELLPLLESHQELLSEAIGEITKIQEMEQEKKRIAESIGSKDSVMREFAKKVRAAEQVLEYALEDYDDYRRPKRMSRADASSSQAAVGLGTIDVKELVAYAHRISYTTFAPPEYATGQVTLRGAFPPAPQDEQMRASQLYHAADMDLGIPKPTISSASPATSADTNIETSKLNLEGSQMSSALRLPAGVPLPPIPPGWRPGMPIELPTDLPPVPPGWKPGDPIPLPPGLEFPPVPPGWKPGDPVPLPPSVTASRLQDQVTPKPTPALSVPSAPRGVIQVPFVQLDLNPELEEDYGSEYSDEDGSSEEDDD